MGSGIEGGVAQGPLINERAVEKTASLVCKSIEQYFSFLFLPPSPCFSLSLFLLFVSFSLSLSQVNEALAGGAEAVVGGGQHSLGGNFFSPTVLSGKNLFLNCYYSNFFD